MKVFFFVILFMLYLNCFGQKKLPIYFDISNAQWKGPRLNDTTYIDVSYQEKTCRLQILLRSFQGKSSIKLFSGDTLLVTGQYDNSLGILKKYSISRIAETMRNAEIRIVEYYSPLRDGKWTYYKSNGDIDRIEIFDKGIFIRQE